MKADLRLFVASARMQDLLIRAKYLVFAAMLMAAFEEERKRGQNVLFPIRLDDAVMTTSEAWASKLRARLIGDFTRWKDHDAYKQSFERVVRDLNKVVQPAK